MGYEQLPDTPWHIGYSKKEEADPRRHMSRCIYLLAGKKICNCKKSPYYRVRCGGSAHCRFYAETIQQAKENQKAMMTVEEEAQATQEEQERAEEYRQIKIRQRILLGRTHSSEEIKRLYGKMKYCPVCLGDLVDGKCDYCGFFIPKKHKKSKENPKSADKNSVKTREKKGSEIKEFSTAKANKKEILAKSISVPKQKVTVQDPRHLMRISGSPNTAC